MAVTDPLQPVDCPESRRSIWGKRTSPVYVTLDIRNGRNTRHGAYPMSFPDLPKNASFPDLEEAAAGLDGCVRALANGFPDLRAVDVANLEVGRAVRVQLGSRFLVRHRRQDDLRLSCMMLIRMVSANNAALTLLSAGYEQDAHVLWRMIDEAYEDVVLMVGSLGETRAPIDDQHRLISLQEDPDDPDGFSSSSHHNLVRQRNIHAAFSRLPEAVQSQANSLLHSLLAVELVARGAYRADVVERACGVAAELARRTGCLNAEEISKIEARRFTLVRPR
jgi:hypothetical protein